MRIEYPYTISLSSATGQGCAAHSGCYSIGVKVLSAWTIRHWLLYDAEFGLLLTLEQMYGALTSSLANREVVDASLRQQEAGFARLAPDLRHGAPMCSPPRADARRHRQNTPA